MSRLPVFVHVAAVAALALAHEDLIFAASETPVRPVLAQKQLVSGTNCQTAASGTRKPDFLANSAEYRDDALITIRYCSATSHNQLTPNTPEIVVVGADPDASGGVKIFFNTIPKNDPKKVHDICVRAGGAAFAYLQTATAATPRADAAMAGADVLTNSGKVECESFLRATAVDSPLVVFAPGVISGSVLSVHILNMIGLKKPATEVQVAVDNLGHQVPSSVALSTDEIRKYPQIVLGPQGLP